MRRFDISPVICALAMLLAAASNAEERDWNIALDFETGAVISGYNDVRIPGDTGTKFSLSEDLESDTPVFWRARLSYRIGARHTLSALVAPLTIEADGTLMKDVTFRDVTFVTGTPIDATYRFDSYRLTYRYRFIEKERLFLGLGLTAKIRDAVISLRSADREAEKPNTGFVPLINFRLQWLLSERAGLLLDGDALAAPQGRAEDLLVALLYRATDQLAFRGGYRVLEGGADNDEVYTFALFHYVSLGMELWF